MNSTGAFFARSMREGGRRRCGSRGRPPPWWTQREEGRRGAGFRGSEATTAVDSGGGRRRPLVGSGDRPWRSGTRALGQRTGIRGRTAIGDDGRRRLLVGSGTGHGTREPGP